MWPQHVRAHTAHARRGRLRNRFRYGVDYVLIDPQAACGPRLFSRNRLNLGAVHDRDHGGQTGAGSGLAWAKRQLRDADVGFDKVLLLAQPRVLGYLFNPVSFWLAWRKTELVAVIAEVNNTFGQRHSYLCMHQDGRPIRKQDRIRGRKMFHVSPFQDVSGQYRFSFDITARRVAIRIALLDKAEGVVATLLGRREPLTSLGLLGALLRRPAGPLRTIALIHWQALRLRVKGARYRSPPAAPTKEITPCR